MSQLPLMKFWFVVLNIFYFPFHIWDVILPIDELHDFSRWLSHHQPELVVVDNIL